MKKASKKTPTKPSVKALNKNIKEILPKKSLFKKNFTYPVIAVLVIVAAVLVKGIIDDNTKNNFKRTILPETVKKLVTGNAKVTIGSIKDVSGVYEFDLTLGTGNNANGQKYISYITKDGKILFTSGIKLEELNKQQVQGAATTGAEQKKLTCNDVNKSDTPKLTAFVVADCPFGLQTQRLLKKAVTEQPALTQNLDVKYIGAIENGKITSMHGDKEAQENLRQICVREEQKEKYWPYVGCYMQEGKSEECLASQGVDALRVKACMEDVNRGNAYAQKDFDLANKYQVSGSPTLLANDSQVISEFDFGGRVANSIKNIVCCASKNKGDYCEKELTTSEVATSFSKTDEAAATANSSASCN